VLIKTFIYHAARFQRSTHFSSVLNEVVYFNRLTDSRLGFSINFISPFILGQLEKISQTRLHLQHTVTHYRQNSAFCIITVYMNFIKYTFNR